MSTANRTSPFCKGSSPAKRSSTLEQLQLTDEERISLKQQGFVQGERRSDNCRIYKLRFRFRGRQRVLYLGTNAALAAAVKEELQELQREESAHRELRKLTRQARLLLQNCKPRLTKSVEKAGYRFHGRDVRRPRTLANVEKTNQSHPTL